MREMNEDSNAPITVMTILMHSLVSFSTFDEKYATRHQFVPEQEKTVGDLLHHSGYPFVPRFAYKLHEIRALHSW